MSLDTKSKRGSTMLLGAPWRPWLTEPTGTLDPEPRLSLLKLSTAVSPGLPPETSGWGAGGIYGSFVGAIQSSLYGAFGYFDEDGEDDEYYG